MSNARKLANRSTDTVSVKDFGAVGDGTTDDTAAIQAALNAGLSLGKSVFVPAGDYSVSVLQLPLAAYTAPFCISGEGCGITTIQKRSADGLSLFTVGSITATAYSTELWVQGLTFSGLAGNTPVAVQLYDLVRSTFQACIFQNSISGLKSSGGISNTYQNCIFQNNQIGANFDKFTSLAGGGYPNNNELKSCIVVGNTSYGVYFDNGRSLNITDCDIEGNGTLGNSGTMGIYVANVNAENSGAYPSVGVSVINCWLESNAGDAAVQLNSGVNTIRSSYFVANTNATNDIHVVGGIYHLSEVAFGSNKAANLNEGSGSLTGSSIVNCFDALVGTFSYTPSKTMVHGAWNSGSGVRINSLLMRSGAAPVVMSVANPMIQTGTATTSTGGTIAVTFPTAYSATPVVTTSILDGSPGKVLCAQIGSLTSSGFTLLVTYVQSGSSTVNTIVSENVNWVAIGAT